MEDRHHRFEAMVRALSTGLYRYAFWLCRDRNTAEDLVQETFMRAWKGLDGLRDDRKAKSWLMTTLRREFARQMARQRPTIEDLDLEQCAGDAPTGEESREIWELRRALALLPDSYREPLALQVLGGYETAEIAEMLDMPRATVLTRLFRARQKLRDALETPGSVSADGWQKP